MDLIDPIMVKALKGFWEHNSAMRLSNVLIIITIVLLSLNACSNIKMYPNTKTRQIETRQLRSKDRFIGTNQIKIAKGDTLWAISKHYDLPMRDIIAANSLKPPYVLLSGRRLVLPKRNDHQVMHKETLYSISQRYGINPATLARINKLKPPYTIHVGQKLRLPSKHTTKKPQVQVVAAQKQTTVTLKKVPRKVKVSQKSRPAPHKKATLPKPSAKSDRFSWPLQGRIISNFGSQKKGLRNDGINIAAPRGAPVHAAENGVVVYAGNELRGFGNLLLLKHAKGWVTAYAHTDKLIVERGDKVRKGQKIAHVGTTGGVTTPQLHFEIRKGKRAVNPQKYL